MARLTLILVAFFVRFDWVEAAVKSEKSCPPEVRVCGLLRPFEDARRLYSAMSGDDDTYPFWWEPVVIPPVQPPSPDVTYCHPVDCTTYSTTKLRGGNPFGRDQDDWEDLYKDNNLEKQLKSIWQQILNSDPSCPSGCLNAGSDLTSRLVIQPVPSDRVCGSSGSPSTHSISVTGKSLHCAIAGWRASEYFQDRLRELTSGACSDSNCSPSVSISKIAVKITPGGTFDRCRVDMSAEVTIACTGNSSSGEYEAWFEVTECPRCARVKPPVVQD